MLPYQILPSLEAQLAVKTESSPSIVAKSLHSPDGGFSPVGLPPVGLPPVGLSPVGLSPVGLSLVGLSPVGLSPVGHATQVPSSLLNAKMSSSPFTHFG